MLVSVGGGSPLGQSRQQGKKIHRKWQFNPLPIVSFYIAGQGFSTGKEEAPCI